MSISTVHIDDPARYFDHDTYDGSSCLHILPLVKHAWRRAKNLCFGVRLRHRTKSGGAQLQRPIDVTQVQPRSCEKVTLGLLLALIYKREQIELQPAAKIATAQVTEVLLTSDIAIVDDLYLRLSCVPLDHDLIDWQEQKRVRDLRDFAIRICRRLARQVRPWPAGPTNDPGITHTPPPSPDASSPSTTTVSKNICTSIPWESGSLIPKYKAANEIFAERCAIILGQQPRKCQTGAFFTSTTNLRHNYNEGHWYIVSGRHIDLAEEIVRRAPRKILDKLLDPLQLEIGLRGKVDAWFAALPYGHYRRSRLAGHTQHRGILEQMLHVLEEGRRSYWSDDW